MKGSARPLTVGEVGDTAGPDDWRDSAACLGLIELMFDPDRIGEALEVCKSCPVIGECRDVVMGDSYLRRAYAHVGAVVAGLAPAQLKKRRSDAKPVEVRVVRCLYCHETFVPKGKTRMCSARCRNKRHLAQKQRWEKSRYVSLPSVSDQG